MKTKTHLGDLDLEVLNPIETKKVLGGGWNDYDYHEIDEVIIWGGGGGYDGGGWGYDPSHGGNDYPDYGGGGSDNSGGPGDGSLPSPPTHICTQGDFSKTCATMALSYVANYFGGTGLTSSDFAEMSGIQYTGMLTGMAEGLNNSQLQSIMGSIFQSTIIDGTNGNTIANELNSGHPILGSIDQGGGIGHEVVITGFNSSAGTITYMDSLVGGAVTASVSSVSFVGSLFAVSGLQNNATVDKYKSDTNDVKCSICGH